MTASTETLLAALVQCIAGLTGEIRALRAELARDPKRPEYAVLLRAIDAAFPNQPFSSVDVALACDGSRPTADSLRVAVIGAARAVNARYLGEVFKNIEGFDQGGRQIRRVGKKERDGVVWRVAPSGDVTVKAAQSHQILAPARGRTP